MDGNFHWRICHIHVHVRHIQASCTSERRAPHSTHTQREIETHRVEFTHCGIEANDSDDQRNPRNDKRDWRREIFPHRFHAHRQVFSSVELLQPNWMCQCNGRFSILYRNDFNISSSYNTFFCFSFFLSLRIHFTAWRGNANRSHRRKKNIYRQFNL